MKDENLRFRISILLALICTVFFSFISCNEHSENLSSQKPNNTVMWTKNYDAIIEEYKRFANCIIDEDIESVFEKNIFIYPEKESLYNWENMLVEVNVWSYRDFPKEISSFGYALTDLNDDNNEELILLLKDYTVLAIFSNSNNMSTLIDAYWPKHRCAIYESGLLYTLSSSGAADWYYRIQEISKDGELIDLKEYGYYEDYYKIVDGKRYTISEFEFNEFQDEYPVLFDNVASNITRNSGIEFLPLSNN